MSIEVYPDSNSEPPVLGKSATQFPRTDLLGNALACIIPMLMFLEVKFFGRLFISEILLLFMLPFLLIARWRLLLTPLPKKLLLLGGAWLLAQVLTDFIRATPIEDWSRGWAKIVFLLLNFSTIYLYLNRKEKRFLLFAVGIALGQILLFFLNPNIYAEGLPWKFGYGFAITTLTVLATQHRVFKKRLFLQCIILLGIGLLNIYMGFRSMGLICLLVAFFVLIKRSNRFHLKKKNFLSIVKLLFLISVTVICITEFYGFAASEGWFGEKAQDLYLRQSSGVLGILVGGRSEILGSLQAVIDSPIIGHGSWAKNREYIEIMQDYLIQLGYKIQLTPTSDLIPSHSYFWGAWVEAGFIGAIFWLWVLIQTVRTMIAILRIKANIKIMPLIAFVAFNLIWNISFSPFGAEARLYVAYYFSLMIFAITSSSSYQYNVIRIE